MIAGFFYCAPGIEHRLILQLTLRTYKVERLINCLPLISPGTETLDFFQNVSFSNFALPPGFRLVTHF